MHKNIDAEGYETDKALSGYLETYQEYFRPLADKKICLLEMGINKGGSLLLWKDYFTNGFIVGLDLIPVTVDDASGRICTYQGEQQDVSLLDRIAHESAPEGFDIIIDDCSHIGQLSRISFWHLFNNHLKSGGIYIIEDWGTGYWHDWIDGKGYNPRFHRNNFLQVIISNVVDLLKPIMRRFFASQLTDKLMALKYYRNRFPSHDYGMVGFVKQLVDECAMNDISHPEFGNGTGLKTLFKQMLISNGQVIIVKA